jgi:hypothetical protein
VALRQRQHGSACFRVALGQRQHEPCVFCVALRQRQHDSACFRVALRQRQHDLYVSAWHCARGITTSCLRDQLRIRRGSPRNHLHRFKRHRFKLRIHKGLERSSVSVEGLTPASCSSCSSHGACNAWGQEPVLKLGRKLRHFSERVSMTQAPYP